MKTAFNVTDKFLSTVNLLRKKLSSKNAMLCIEPIDLLVQTIYQGQVEKVQKVIQIELRKKTACFVIFKFYFFIQAMGSGPYWYQIVNKAFYTLKVSNF